MAKRALNNVSLQDLLAQLKKHQARLPKLQRKEKKLLKQLAAVQAEIAALGGAVQARPASIKGSGKKPGRPVGKGGKRPKNKVKLADAIVAVLSKDKSVTVKDIIAAVKANGYVSTSKTFGTIVYQTLGRDKRVKRAGRGKYQLKG